MKSTLLRHSVVISCILYLLWRIIFNAFWSKIQIVINGSYFDAIMKHKSPRKFMNNSRLPTKMIKTRCDSNAKEKRTKFLKRYTTSKRSFASRWFVKSFWDFCVTYQPSARFDNLCTNSCTSTFKIFIDKFQWNRHA